MSKTWHSGHKEMVVNKLHKHSNNKKGVFHILFYSSADERNTDNKFDRTFHLKLNRIITLYLKHIDTRKIALNIHDS